MVELHQYQKDLLQKAERALAVQDARVMLQLPTGGGKTRIAAALLAGWMRSGGKAAWLTHRRELSDQTCQVLDESGVLAVSRPEWDFYDRAPGWKGWVVILMTQTVSRRNHFEGVWDEYGSEDLLIIDEAHHAPARGWERAISQWPGRVIGLTATPWRIEKGLGFDHLFDCLIPGPQIKDLQSDGYLADAKVLMPDSDGIIIGGRLNSRGEYIEREIELANQGRPGVMTAGALEFWQNRAQGRQTIVYAVSKGHAENMAGVFNQAGFPADVILSETPAELRDWYIRQFREGKLKVLVNIAVATEGFDLPDASCVVLARPTMSLALYLQMVGRGLRPKSDGGDCLILDLAGNVRRHCFPDVERKWSLKPRGQQAEGEPPPVVQRCPDCEGVSPAASHSCLVCENPFGKTCQRCGQWRAWKRWSAETYCGSDHDQVCNWCHPDAHKLARLPLIGELREILKEELKSHWEVNLAELSTLSAVQTQMREIAKELASAYDQAAFNHLTKQLDCLIKRQSQMRGAFLKELREKMGDNYRGWISFIEDRGGKMDELVDFGEKGGVYYLRWRKISRAIRIDEDGLLMWDHFGDMGSSRW